MSAQDGGCLERTAVSNANQPAVTRDWRNESSEERDDRNLAELLRELRVAGLGVQVLFGFLLALPFSARFAQLGQAQRDLYVTDLVLVRHRPRACCRRDGVACRPGGLPPAGVPTASERASGAVRQHHGHLRAGDRGASCIGGGAADRQLCHARSAHCRHRRLRAAALCEPVVRLAGHQARAAISATAIRPDCWFRPCRWLAAWSAG